MVALPAMESDGESRAHPRAKAQIKVEYHHGTTTGIGHSDDISEGGIYLSCNQPAAPGTRVYLRLHLPSSPSGDPLKLIGVVTRSTNQRTMPDVDSSPGMAIAFQVAYARTKDQLHDFMQMLLEKGEVLGDVDRLEDGEGPPAYVARFPDLEGQERARTIPPRELEAAFSFTPLPPEAEPAPEEESDGVAFRIAVIVVVLVLMAAVIYQLIQNS